MENVNYEQLWGEMCIFRLIFNKNRGGGLIKKKR